MIENSTPLHVVSDDGLTLTTYALIDGIDYKISTSWNDLEDAKAKYESVKFNNEKKIYIDASKNDIVGAKSHIKKFSKFGITLTVGFLKGHVYDTYELSLGKTSITASIVDGHVKWNTLKWNKKTSNAYMLFGIGGKSNAYFFSISPR